MPARRQPTLFILLLLAGLLTGASCFSQPAPPYSPAAARQRPPVALSSQLPHLTSTEVCGNGIDDDGNGLADDKDFACYYASSTGGCKPSTVVWANSYNGLYWVDPQTGTSKFIAQLTAGLGDLAWASNGRLYGLSGNAIYEINPYNGQLLSTAYLPAGYQGINAMTGDAQGNLYLSMYATNTPSPSVYVGKYSIATGQVTLIVNISARGLVSAGDVSFFKGYLYLSCGGNVLARIDPASGSLQTLSFSAPVGCDAYGLVTLGDGYLYVTNRNDLYRIDMTTMQASLYYTFPFNDVPYGLSTYAENCNAPSCSNPTITVTTATGQPYCSTPGVALSATGAGITGGSAVTWTLPDGTKSTGPTLQATLSGTYTARYHNMADDCGHDSSFSLTIAPSPHAALGNDTLVCQGSTVRLAPLDPTGITAWLWQDGSTAPYYIAFATGTYTLQASNACGVSQASIKVLQATVPRVQLRADTSICPGASIKLFNEQPKQPWDVYSWSTAAAADTITVSDGALYWLESKNSCGRARDSVALAITDSCTCFPFYARVALPGDTELCSFDSLLLRNALHADGFHYRWQNGSTEPQLMVRGPGIYRVDVSTWCGTVRDSTVVTAKKYGCDRSVKVPNAFSPGGGSNDLFRPVVTGPLMQYEFMVYNRWGQLLFYSTQRGAGWDGRVNGQPQAPGVYVWSCRYRFAGLPQAAERGTVLLVK